MSSHALTANSYVPTLITLLLFCDAIRGQSTGSIEGQVIDQKDAVVFAAGVRASSPEILVDPQVWSAMLPMVGWSRSFRSTAVSFRTLACSLQAP
jgi:hypothetical protein